MSKWTDLLGTTSSYFRIGGTGGPRLKNSSGVIEARDSGDSAYAILRCSDPSGSSDAATKNYIDKLRRYFFHAAAMGIPGTNWNDTSAAPTAADANNSQIQVVRFDDTTADSRTFGVIYIPSGATTLALEYLIRPGTTPAGSRTVAVKLSYQRVGNTAAVASWASYTLSDLTITASAYFHELTHSVALATPSTALTAGAYYNMQISMAGAPSGGTKLTGKRDVAAVRLWFY